MFSFLDRYPLWERNLREGLQERVHPSLHKYCWVIELSKVTKLLQLDALRKLPPNTSGRLPVQTPCIKDPLGFPPDYNNFSCFELSEMEAKASRSGLLLAHTRTKGRMFETRSYNFPHFWASGTLPTVSNNGGSGWGRVCLGKPRRLNIQRSGAHCFVVTCLEVSDFKMIISL